MRKTWNMVGKMTVCSLAAAMMVMIGTEFGMTAHAEMIIDSMEEIQASQDVQNMVPGSADEEVFMVDAPAAEAMAPEAGEAGIDVGEIVVIEDNLLPGAGLPDLAFEEGEAEALPAPEAEEVEVLEEKAVGASETCVSGTLTYEDDEVAVTVVASKAAQLPANTEVKVTKLEEGSAEYEAAKAAACQSVEADEDASYAFYDITLESEGQVLDVEEGTVSVQMEFKTVKTEKKDVVSIEETESGKVARNVTDTTADERTGSVAIDY